VVFDKLNLNGDGISIYNLVAKVASRPDKKVMDCLVVSKDWKEHDATYVIDSYNVHDELGWTSKINLD